MTYRKPTSQTHKTLLATSAFLTLWSVWKNTDKKSKMIERFPQVSSLEVVSLFVVSLFGHQNHWKRPTHVFALAVLILSWYHRHDKYKHK